MSRQHFSFIRMGDGELRFLLDCQEGKTDIIRPTVSIPSISAGVAGAASNKPQDYHKILKAYESADCVDLHLHIPSIRDRIATLQWTPNPNGWQSSGAENSRLLPRWTVAHFKEFLNNKRVLFFGGEAKLLEALLSDPEYRILAKDFFPDHLNAVFIDPPGEGFNLSEDYPLIKNLIETQLKTSKFDAVFISASGMAKPLCVELSAIHKVKTLDFGAILRALTYSATSGRAGWPANHFPFFFHIPLNVYLEAVRKAYPEIQSSVLVAKANAQLMFDLIKKNYEHSIGRSKISLATKADAEYQIFIRDFAYYKSYFTKTLKNTNLQQFKDFHTWMYHSGYSEHTPLSFRIRALLSKVSKQWKSALAFRIKN
jgi:hypothetical protein